MIFVYRNISGAVAFDAGDKGLAIFGTLAASTTDIGLDGKFKQCFPLDACVRPIGHPLDYFLGAVGMEVKNGSFLKETNGIGNTVVRNPFNDINAGICAVF